MHTGRNEPCPCGSGRKYKQCCEAADRAARAKNLPTSRARSEPDWQVDAIPLLTRFRDRNSPRPVLLLVTAGDEVVHLDLRGRLAGGTVAVAGALENAVTEAARKAGAFPERLFVRHTAVAEQLVARFAPRCTEIRGGSVSHLEMVASPLIQEVAGVVHWPPMSRPDTWAGWDLPRSLVAEVFAAAADFHRAAPWNALGNLQAPRAFLPSGREWTCCVLGEAGEEFGLVLYSDADDIARFVNPVVPDRPLTDIRGEVITLTFDRNIELDPPMRAEIRREKWPLADPDAVPVMYTVNTPGGGVTADDMRELISLLRAVPAFADAHRRELILEQNGRAINPIDWTDTTTVIRFRYDGPVPDHDSIGEYGEPFEDMSGQLREAVQLALQELGEDADESEIREHINGTLTRITDQMNTTPRAEFGGLSPMQVQRVLDGEWDTPGGVLRYAHDLSFDDVARLRTPANARVLLEYVREQRGLRATQARNLKLDAVAELRERLDLDRGGRPFTTGTRVTEQDIEELYLLRVSCELAGLLELQSGRFRITAEAETLLAPERAGEFCARLFHARFHELDFDDALMTFDWPELQDQLVYTLHRLPECARMWRAGAELLEETVLPFAIRRLYEREGPDAAVLTTFRFLWQVLEPLIGFGLIERSPAVTDAPLPRVDERYRVTPLATRFITIDLATT